MEIWSCWVSSKQGEHLRIGWSDSQTREIWRSKISEKITSNWTDPKIREKMIAGMKGKKRTPEQCERMRQEMQRRRLARIEGR